MSGTHESREAAKKAISRTRWRVASALTATMMIVYFGFILLIAFAKPSMGTVLAPGLSVGIALGAGVIAAAWVVTGIYVLWANRRFDPAVRAARAAAGD